MHTYFNSADVFPLESGVDSTTPLGDPITFTFTVNGGEFPLITQFTFIALLHTPAIQPNQISYDTESNLVTVAYVYADPSLTGEYVLCAEAPPPPSKRKRRGVSSVPERPQLCSGRVAINVTGMCPT